MTEIYMLTHYYMYISSHLQNFQELIEAALSVNCSVNTNIGSIMKCISGYPEKATSFMKSSIFKKVKIRTEK